MAAIEHSDLGALSEVDSLSDTDWLEVASSRESEDNDSILDESDAEPDDQRRSRASSVGAPSAPDVDRWEGLIDDVLAVCDNPLETRPFSPPPPAPARAPTSPLARNVLATEEDLVEDERVRHALNQSMMSTLGSSRSSHVGSELRLSFPDPITSSRDDLNRSFEAVDLPSDSGDTILFSDGEQTGADNTMSSMPSTASSDVGSMLTPDIPEVQDTGDAPIGKEAGSLPDVTAEEEAKSLNTPPSPVVADDKKLPIKLVKDHLPRLHVTTIVAVLSLALGYMMTGSMSNTLTTSSPGAPLPTSSNVSSLRVPSSINLTVPAAKTKLGINESGAVALVVSSMSDFALSIIKPTTSALAVRPSNGATLALVANKDGATDVALSSCANVIGSSKRRELAVAIASSSTLPPIATSLSNVNVHPSTSLSVIPPTSSTVDVQSPSTHPKWDAKGKGKAAGSEPSMPAQSFELSKHVFTSLLDDHLRAIGAAIAADMHDLVHALDELTKALTSAGATVSLHGAALGHASIARAQEGLKRARELRSSLRENFRGRHGRARESARALKTVGQRWISGASNVGAQLIEGARARVRGHSEVARRNAKSLRGERALKHDRRTRRTQEQDERRANAQEKRPARRGGTLQRTGAVVQV